MQIKFKEKAGLAEDFQSLQIRFSFVKKYKDYYIQLTDSVLCRDFLTDVLWCQQHQKDIQIYGFKWKYRKINPKLLLLQFPDEVFYKTFKENLIDLNNLELIHNLTKTKIIEDDAATNSVIISFDLKWQKELWSFSFYTYLLKWIGLTSLLKPEELTGTELKYYKEVKEAIENLFANLQIYLEIISIFPDKDVELRRVHHYSGFKAKHEHFTLQNPMS